MPLTGLANAAIDHVEPERSSFAERLARYAEADLACYRAEWPPSWPRGRRGAGTTCWPGRGGDTTCDFARRPGFCTWPNRRHTAERLAQAVAELDPFCLAGLSSFVSCGRLPGRPAWPSSRERSTDAAWNAVASIDDRWQLEQWGADARLKPRWRIAGAISWRRRNSWNCWTDRSSPSRSDGEGRPVAEKATGRRAARTVAGPSVSASR